MRKRGLCYRPVSVRQSVCDVRVLIQTIKDTIKLVSQPNSPIILVSSCRPVSPNFKGNRFSRGVKYAGVGEWRNFVIFD